MRRSALAGLLVGLTVLAGLLVAPPVAGSPATVAPSVGQRSDTVLSGGWRFHQRDVAGAEQTGFDDSGWKHVSIPHTWNALDGEDGSATPAQADYYQGPGWYRLSLAVPDTAAGQRLFLQFDAANLVADVWANAVHLGQHRGGYTTFRFDATASLHVGTGNVIAVRVNNAVDTTIAPVDADYTFFGGLYRPVHLIVTNPVHVTLLDHGGPGVQLRQSSVSAASALLDVVSTITNDSASVASATLDSLIIDAGGATLPAVTSAVSVPAHGSLQVHQSRTISSPHRWNGKADPYLYRVWVLVVRAGTTVDGISQPLGLRSLRVDPAAGFFLNGAHVGLHGVSMHQDRFAKGWAVTPADLDQDWSFVSEIGANAVRLSHYNHDAHIYDLADRAGVSVWAESPVIDGIPAGSGYAANAADQLQELIRQNFNHPSVICWGLSNEIVDAGGDAVALMQSLDALAHQEDSSRPTTLAQPQAFAGTPVSRQADLVGYNAYFGWYTGTVGDFGGWADATHAASPSLPMAVSEYGAGASVYIHTDPAVRRDHSEEYQALFHQSHWQQMKVRPYLWATFVWNLFDFGSDHRSEGDEAGRNDKGLVTYDRTMRKDAFYFYKTQWTDAHAVHLGSAHWTDRSQRATTVTVYSNGDSVELFVGGTSLGTKVQTGGRVFTWAVTLPPGATTVAAVSHKGASRLTDAATWTVRPARTSAHIDAGSATGHTSSDGTIWTADSFSHGGSLGSTSASISGAPDQALVRTYRSGNFTYDVPMATGSYSVTLSFVEPSSVAVGRRQFSVSAQSVNQIYRLDLTAVAGQNRAVTRTFNVAVTNGTLALAFQPTAGSAVVSAIAVTAS